MASPTIDSTNSFKNSQNVSPTSTSAEDEASNELIFTMFIGSFMSRPIQES